MLPDADRWRNSQPHVTYVIGAYCAYGLVVGSRTSTREASMTAQTETRFTRYAFALVVALVGMITVAGLILGNAMWPRAAAAATTGSRIEIRTLMSKIDTTRMPVLEIADLT